MPRIAIIGGGSAYMPGLALSFARESDLFAGSQLVLHDIDAAALDVQARLTASILRARSAEIAVEAIGDLERAIEGADFVLTTFRPGGLEARHRDESIPPEYGVIGQETTGPGGLAMAMTLLGGSHRGSRPCGFSAPGRPPGRPGRRRPPR